MATLQLPPDARVVAVIEDAGRLIEAELHRMFRASRVRGEWFASTPELEAVIRTFATT